MERPNPVAAALVCLSTSALPRVGEVGALDCEDLEIMGHRSITTTKDYIGVNLRHMAKAMLAYRVPQPCAAMNLSSR